MRKWNSLSGTVVQTVRLVGEDESFKVKWEVFWMCEGQELERGVF